MEPRMPPRKPRGVVRRRSIRPVSRECPCCLSPNVRVPSVSHCPVCSHAFAVPVVLGRYTDYWRWRVSHPTQWAWLADHAPDTHFARSLVQALNDFGSFTPNQQAALDRITKGKP